MPARCVLRVAPMRAAVAAGALAGMSHETANPASMDAIAFRKAVELLSRMNERRVEYKVVGAVAMIVQGVVRATADMDLFVNPTRENVERLKQAMRDVWNDPCIDDISYEDIAGDYPAVAYGPPDDSLPLDILARLGEMYDYAGIEAESKPFGELVVRVATPRMLYRMKRGTVRPQDRADADILMEVFKLEEEL